MRTKLKVINLFLREALFILGVCSFLFGGMIADSDPIRIPIFFIVFGAFLVFASNPEKLLNDWEVWKRARRIKKIRDNIL